jgi:hypothetical protein
MHYRTPNVGRGIAAVTGTYARSYSEGGFDWHESTDEFRRQLIGMTERYLSNNNISMSQAPHNIITQPQDLEDLTAVLAKHPEFEVQTYQPDKILN